MDRRSIIFALAVFSALYLVNSYFDWQYEGQIREWKAEQQVKKQQTLVDLQRELADHSISAAELPLLYLYSDTEAKEFLSTAIRSNGALMTTGWGTDIPKTVYARPIASSEAPKPYTLTFGAAESGNLLVYQSSDPALPKIGELPDVGSFFLQVVQFLPENKERPFLIQPAEFRDGALTLLQARIDALQLAINPEAAITPIPKASGIVLMPEDGNFLPAAIYNGDSHSVIYLEDFTGLATLTEKIGPQGQSLPQQGTQQYFVLENQYQQLVFSNIGGALVEINLPFESNIDTVSAVHPIEFDRYIADHLPYNDHFPAHPYFKPSTNPQGPFIEHASGPVGGFYPLLRRDLIEGPGRHSVRLNPRYYALNLLSEYPEVAELTYTVKEFTTERIIFEAKQPHRTIRKTFSLPQDPLAAYSLDISINIDGDKRGLWLSTGVPEVELFSGVPAPALKYRLTRNQKSSVDSIDLPTDAITNSSIFPDWVCNSNGFFGIILDPLNDIDAGFRAAYVPGTAAPSRLVEIDQAHDRFKAQDLPGYLLMMPLKALGNETRFRLYAGPLSDTTLNQVDAVYSDPNTGYNPDYRASQSYHGWFAFISEPFAKVLFIVMKFFHSITGSWGLSIILLTVAMRIALYPLNAWSTSSMLRMQQIGPEVSALQERYKNDPKKLQQEMIALYRDRKINPLSGCLPLLIQMPFLVGMFDLLKTTFELRGVSFIPGWIDNLTAPDVLFSWETPIFFFGTEFHLLPILLGLVMLIQQRISSPLPSDSSQLTDQQRQQRAMGSMMSIVFMFMFYNFPSGLNIYWLSSTLLGIAQQWWMQRQAAIRAAIAPIAALSAAKTPKTKR